LVTRGTVFPSGAFAYLQLCSGCRQPGQILSCGSPELRRLSSKIVEPYWLSSPSSLLFHGVLWKSALRSSDRRGERLRCKHLGRSASLVLGRHYRVLPQRLVVEFHARIERKANLRGKATISQSASAAFPVRGTDPRASVPSLRCRAGEPERQRSRNARGGRVGAVSVVGRSRLPARHAVTSDGAHANELATSFT
jgi:hypothetical protein